MPQFSNIQQRIRLLLVFTLVCFTVCGLFTLHTLNEIKINGPIYQRIKLSQDLIADILPPPEYLLEPYLTALQYQAVPDDPRQQLQLKERLLRLEHDYEERYAFWKSASLDPELRDLFIVRSDHFARGFFGEVRQNLIPAMESYDLVRAQNSIRALHALYAGQREIIDQLVAHARALNEADETRASDRIRELSAMLLLMSAVAIVALMLAFHRTSRDISRPILEALEATKRLASGDWGQERHTGSGGDEAGQIVKAAQEIVRGAQAELVRAEKLAALGALVAGISHELNTPIGNGLLAVSSLVREVELFKEETRQGVKRSSLERFVQVAEEAGEIALRNIERSATLIRSFKQVAVDRTTSQRRKFMLDRVVHETVVTLRPLFKRTQVEVIERVPSAIELDSFPGSLGQVVSNLMENAVVHGFEGSSGTITVDVVLHEADSTVVIVVADNGKGVPDNIRERIYDPFFTTRLGQGGSGLGLHIACNIVTGVLGGELSLRSPGRGAVFEIRVPLVAPRDQQAAEEEGRRWMGSAPPSFA